MDLFASNIGERREKDKSSPKSLDNNHIKSPGTCTAISDGTKSSFARIGLSEWICRSVRVLGFKRPTDIQEAAIPAVLAGNDVLACAATGSGKTAAFALPILNELAKDPFGLFAVILTPTRELALQISEQISAFGASFSVRIALIIGGMNMVQQSGTLATLPHIVIATPGRLRHHLESASAPNMKPTKYLVIDEADRIFCDGFTDDLDVIMNCLGSQHRTLLFSATLTPSLTQLERLAMKNTLRFDLSKENKVPPTLLQEYLFMPAKVKLCYLVTVLRNMISDDNDADIGDVGASTSKVVVQSKKYKKSKNSYKGKDKSSVILEDAQKKNRTDAAIIVFASTCVHCQEVANMLVELGIDCVAMHSMMNQTTRMSSLAKFKSHQTRILVCTDVASRGLDIPAVELVINLDLPSIAAEYVHRVGRTARAGRSGRSVSLVTEYDVELLQGIEAYIGCQLTPSQEVKEEEIIPLLNVVSKAMRLVKMKLMESKFDEKVERRHKRQKIQNNKEKARMLPK